MGEPVVLRGALPEDAEAIHHLNLAALGYDFPRKDTAQRLEQVQGLPGNRIIVAQTAGRVVGYVHAADYECLYTAPLKNIMALAVDPALHGQGIGRRLMERAEAWAREEGCAGVRLVSGMNRRGAHGFYEAIGYHLRKEQKNYIRYF